MEKLFFGGDIITMEQESDHPEAVLIRNGIIAGIGDLADLKKMVEDESCHLIDLKGNTLMPAFIDGHGHVTLTAVQTTQADLSKACCFDDVVQILTDWKESHQLKEGDPIFGASYDHNFLAEEAHPTSEVLDRVSKTNPICIWHTSQHMGCINSAMMKILGYDENTEDPQGGRLGRDPDTGKPNGYIEEAATFPVRMYQAKLPIDLRAIVAEGQMIYVRHGVTTIQDGASNEMFVKICRDMAAEGRLFTDVVAYPAIGAEDTIELIRKNRDCLNKYVNHFKIGGLKAVLDGSPQGKSAWMTKPYENSGDYCGYPWMPDEVVQEGMKMAVDNHLQMLVHCNGDAAGDQFLNAYEQAYRETDNQKKEELRPVMIHCQTVRDDQLDRMVKLNMIPSIFVSHVNYWGDIHLKNLGKERGSRVSPCKSALDRGMIYNFHTDTPVVEPNMFHTIWAAVNRVTRKGIVLGPEQKIGVYDALKGVTLNAAYAYDEEGSKGSIAPGKRADLIIVSDNPLKVDPMKIKDIVVLATMKDGRTIYQKS